MRAAAPASMADRRRKSEVAIFTRVGLERIMRYAFKLAQSRPRELLTVVTKSNAQRHGMARRPEIAVEVSREFPTSPGTRCRCDDGPDDAQAAEPRRHHRHQP